MTTFKRHPEWLADWRATLAEVEGIADSGPEYHANTDEQHRLACLLAGTTAQTAVELQAQFEWFNEQLGDYVRDNVCDELAIVMDRLGEGIKGRIHVSEETRRPVSFPALHERMTELRETCRVTERLCKEGHIEDGPMEDMHDALFTLRMDVYGVASSMVAETPKDLALQMEILMDEAPGDDIRVTDTLHGQMLRTIQEGIKAMAETEGKAA
ncbi:hypothetical protein [Ruegeria jejuensis]|uniref:hypothetical protein n=1 Tax=Ruegeria jejuensis TaxID=3233338 RepID=UPI00355B250E